jgi:hypothetical protein
MMLRIAGAISLSILGALTFPTALAAQEHNVGDWRGGKAPGDPFEGCAYTKELSPGVNLALYQTASTIPVLEIHNTKWNLTAAQTFRVKLGFDETLYDLAAMQSRLRSVASIYFNTLNGKTVVDAMRASDSLSIEVMGEAYYTDLTGIMETADALNACATGTSNSPVEQPVVDAGNIFEQLSAERLATFSCFMSGNQIYGIGMPDGSEMLTYELDLFTDGSLGWNGVRVQPAHRVYSEWVEAEIVGAVFDVRAIFAARAESQSQLPATFSGEDADAFATAMEFVGALTGAAVLGDRQRVLALSVEDEVVAFADVDANGELRNTFTPECYRKR